MWFSIIFLILCLLLVTGQNRESLGEIAKEKLSSPKITILKNTGMETDQETSSINMHIMDEDGIQDIWLTINASKKLTVGQFETVRWNENQTEVTITTKLPLSYGKNLIFVYAQDLSGQENRKKLVITKPHPEEDVSWSNTVRRSLYYLFKRIAQSF